MYLSDVLFLKLKVRVCSLKNFNAESVFRSKTAQEKDVKKLVKKNVKKQKQEN